MRDSTSRERNSQSREYGGLLQRLVFVPGAIILLYGFWLLLSA